MSTSGTVKTKTSLGSYPLGWSVAGVGNFSGGKVTDILWRNYVTGADEIWFMNTSGTVASKTAADAFAKSWTLVQ
jgi:hypothetical protein